MIQRIDNDITILMYLQITQTIFLIFKLRILKLKSPAEFNSSYDMKLGIMKNEYLSIGRKVF